jgi:glycosyltransferase involved in cell wall biosynthesis
MTDIRSEMGRRDTADTAINRYERKETIPLTEWLPYRGVNLYKRWQGPDKIKPWDRKVTIVIPYLDTCETLDTLISSWKLQTVDANIVIIDTGSSPRHIGILDEYEKTDPKIEVHRLRFKAVKHPSDPVAIAMDLAFSLCTTDYLFATHADCFPARRDLIEEMIQLRQDTNAPVVGYGITPRDDIDTQGWVGHTATLFDMKQADLLNLAWSQRRYCHLTGIDHFGNNKCNGYPDTEFLINEQLDRANIARHIIGSESNYVTTNDDNILHVRSYGSAKLYSKKHFQRANTDMSEALKKTESRINAWRNE